MDLQAEKTIIIEQFKQVNDINLIHAIKSMLDYASNKEADLYDIPEEHKNVVRQRMKASQADPSRLLNWDKVKHKIKL